MTTTWTGTFDADWNDPFNWSDGVPTSNDDAIIADVATQPVMNVNGECNNITIQALASLDINGQTLTVSGNFTINSTGILDNTGDGTIKFDGSCQVTSDGDDFDNIEITVGNSIVLLDALQVNDLLNNGAVYYGGFLLTMDGSLTGTGYFAAKGNEVKVSGAWKEHTAGWVKVAGAWKRIIMPSVKVGGAWKSIL